MVMESVVAIMALIAAIILTPGLYFDINVAPAGLGTAGIKEVSDAAVIAAQTISSWGLYYIA